MSCKLKARTGIEAAWAERLADAPRGSVVVVDYLQLLDQKRENIPNWPYRIAR